MTGTRYRMSVPGKIMFPGIGEGREAAESSQSGRRLLLITDFIKTKLRR